MRSLAAATTLAILATVDAQNIVPLSNLNIAAYAGRWFQTHGSASVVNTFQLGGNCVTADYNSTSKGDVVSVLNIVRLNPFGNTLIPVPVSGYAVQSPNAAEQGALQVVLGPTADPEAPRDYSSPNYWVVDVGAINNAGLYSWATVSDPAQDTLYVLVRDVEEFKQCCEDDVLARLAEQGFTTARNAPIPTNQVGCGY
jgi:lipocalin